MNNEPTNCPLCGASLERGHVTTYNEKGKVTAVKCIACADEETISQYKVDDILTTKLTLLSTLAPYSKDKSRSEAPWVKKANAAYEAIQDQVKRFEAAVWRDKGLGKFVLDTEYKGYSASVGLFKNKLSMDIYSIAGRTLIQFERSDTRITLITATPSNVEHLTDLDYAVMGIQGIYAKEEAGLELLRDAQSLWIEKKFNLKRNDKVGVL